MAWSDTVDLGGFGRRHRCMLQPPPGTGRSPGASNVSPSAKRTSEFQVLSAQALTYLVGCCILQPVVPPRASGPRHRRARTLRSALRGPVSSVPKFKPSMNLPKPKAHLIPEVDQPLLRVTPCPLTASRSLQLQVRKRVAGSKVSCSALGSE